MLRREGQGKMEEPDAGLARDQRNKGFRRRRYRHGENLRVFLSLSLSPVLGVLQPSKDVDARQQIYTR